MMKNTREDFIIKLDSADLLKPRSQSLWRKWKRLSSLQRSLLLISALFLVFMFFQWYSYPRLNIEDSPVFASTNTKKTLPDNNAGLIPVEIPPVVISDGGNDANKQMPILPKPPNHGKSGKQKPFVVRGPTNERMQAVVDAFKHSWNNYKKYAWGYDELKPLSKTFSMWFNLGLTIVDSLDTLYIMGLMNEFEEAKHWVANSLSFERGSNINLFECTIRVLGGLLSAFHLSGDKMFLKKAQELGDKLMPAFDTSSGVPFSDVDFSTNRGHNPAWGSESSTSEVSTIQLEFIDLSRVTNDPKYEKAAMRVTKHLHSLYKKQGLVPIYINPSTGAFRQSATITFGARGDSYYEYLLKIWMLTGDSDAASDYIEAMKGMEELLLRETSATKLLYVGELLAGNNFSPKMDHLVCFLGGNLALAASKGLERAKFMTFGRRLTDTCIEFYNRMATGLSPEIVHFNTQKNSTIQQEMFVKTADSHNLQRPETIESLFYLYRLTGNKTYQDVGWKIFQAFEKYTKVEGGYTSIGNVQNPANVQPRNKMESFWLSETLKYFYLLFSDDPSYISLNDYIFNTEAHLIPFSYYFNDDGGNNKSNDKT